MKYYNKEIYSIHKSEIALSRDNLNDIPLEEVLLDRDSIIVKYSYLCEKIARTFNTTEVSSGVLGFSDLVSEGYLGLIAGVENIDPTKLMESKFPERALVAFLSKRIAGSIRRSINNFRGSIRLSEYKIRQIRKDANKNKQLTDLFFNCVFDSIDDNSFDNNNLTVNLNGNEEEYDINFVSSYVIGLIKSSLTNEEANVIIEFYGLNLNAGESKPKVYEMARKLNINEKSIYRDIKSIKDIALDKLASKIDSELIINFLNN